MSEIHDKTDEKNWSNDIEDWESEFDSGDVVIGPGYGNFRTMFAVHEIDLENPLEHVTHRGVFWEETEARVYADTLVNQ
jgi:hypothetical protein